MKLGYSAIASAAVVSILALTFASRACFAQGGEELSPTGRITSGKLDFSQYCAPCHGQDATGDGPVAASLKKRPANLTVLAKNNHGVFPEAEVYEFIDGGKVAEGHGTRDMPIWGYDFMYRRSSHTGPGGAELTDAEVKHKIKRLIRYIKSLQVP